MEETRKDESGYRGYEYREKTVPIGMTSLYLDHYPCFGWEEDPNRPASSSCGKPRRAVGAHVCLGFRRDRKICNKTELTRLQRNFDGCIAEIEGLERSKTSGALAWALTAGLFGTALIAGSVFAVTADPPVIWLMILLAVPGFAGWTAPYFLYRALVGRKTEKVGPLIEAKYDELYEICEKGSRLLM